MFNFKDLDFSPGNIIYDSFDVKPNIPLNNQLDALREDLFQVNYENERYGIDIGWLPEGDPKGNFVVTLIKDYDWDNPIFQKSTNSLEMLNKHVEECVRIMSELLNRKS